MFNYRKRLFYPVYVERQDPIFAKVLLEHYAGRDSELSSSKVTVLRGLDNSNYQGLLILFK